MTNKKKRNQRMAERRKKKTRQMVAEKKLSCLEKQLSIVENTVECQNKKDFNQEIIQEIDRKLVNSFVFIKKSELDSSSGRHCIIC